MERFQKNKKKKQSILVISIGFVFLIAGVILYRTYSLFEKKEDYNVIKGSIPNYIENYDIKINFQLDGVSIQELPERKGIGVESISCDKGASGSWDYLNWNFNVQTLSQTKTTCTINFITRYTEDILNGTDPIWKDELIPVTIETDGIVKKADVKEKWYEYQNREWANAVILRDSNIMYQNGEVIPEDNIESYFVWIPRYQYKIFDMGNYEGLTTIQNKSQVIDIQFGLDTTSDSDTTCKTPMESGKSGKCSVGKYMTHPAFVSFRSTGMWVGKFETGYKDASTKEEAQRNENNPSKVQIKPNVYSWRNIQVVNAYLSSYDYKRNLDSHMMKNTEWGAIVYLQHSSYGSHDNIRINNNSEYKTGYAGVNEPTTGYTGTNISCSTNKDTCNEYGTSSDITRPWNTESGVLASTTKNITGVYDMNGGSWEYVMGVMRNQNGQLCSGSNSNYHSGFNGVYCYSEGSLETGINFPNPKYYDSYTHGTVDEKYNRRILGDAIGEMGPFSSNLYGSRTRQVSSWYNDEAWFLSSGFSWLMRSGKHDMGSGSGVFSFNCDNGPVSADISFRVVLVS